MFQFEWPWLILLLPTPYLAKWLFPTVKKESQPVEMLFPALKRIKEAFPSNMGSKHNNSWPFHLLFFLAWTGLIVALMNPVKVDHYAQVKNKGYDLMLAVDISASMQAVDFSTQSKVLSRLDAVKEVVGKFVKGRQGDRVGLVTFGEFAYLNVPLTLDTHSLAYMLNDTVSGMAGNATAIGDAIGLSVRALKDRPEGSRVLVLLTDGGDNSSSLPPLEAAKLAKKHGIKIYTIGVGQNGPVPFPTKLGTYAMVEVTMDEDLLKKIAESTSGKYFQASNTKALEAIYSEINALEKTEANETLFFLKEPLYRYPLGLAAALLFILVLYQIFDRRAGIATRS